MVSELEKLEIIQQKISESVDTSIKLDLKSIKRVAGFDVAFFQDKAVCASVVFDVKTKNIIEKKYFVSNAPMPYIPGFLAFREGPLIIQAYYDLEHEPDVLLIDGQGIAHEKKCGLATYVGIQLNKPSVGIAKSLTSGEIKNQKIFVDGEECGVVLQTKPQAKPLFVSPGHLIDEQSSFEISKNFIQLPHKLPEPLHEAHKLAKKTAIKLNGGVDIDDSDEEDSEQERIEKEFGVNSGSIV